MEKPKDREHCVFYLIVNGDSIAFNSFFVYTIFNFLNSSLNVISYVEYSSRNSLLP
jgi:hypothetical protein